MMEWALLVASYLLGSVPTGYLAGRFVRGIDLREHGSGNLGATNTFRVLGPRVAAPVMVLDVMKGFVPAALFPAWSGEQLLGWALLFGAAAIAGHLWSVFMRFRGGKGVATAAGVFLAITPGAVLIAFVVWIAVLKLWMMVSLASISAALTLALVLLLTEGRPAVLALGLSVAALVVIAHHANIRRIIRGDEHRFGMRKLDKEEV
jgi:glycerol-3-phosphate acyltransferase PlsY